MKRESCNKPWFCRSKAAKVVTSSKRFSQERRWRREKRNVFEVKFGSGEIMSSWETDDRRGDYLLYLHLLAFTFLARALSPFCIWLDDVFRYEEKLFKLSWSFESSFCHNAVFVGKQYYPWNTFLILLLRMNVL